MKVINIRLTPAALVKIPENTPDGGQIYEFIDADELVVKDEYHSMEELYDHRMALNIALFHAWHNASDIYDIGVVKSKMHFDGTMFEGYFIVMAITGYGQISYHYKLEHWDKFKIEEVERTPKYDGHTSQDVIERLMKL